MSFLTRMEWDPLELHILDLTITPYDTSDARSWTREVVPSMVTLARPADGSLGAT
jgi:hypothetical protein